jgi:hypothetical protein
MNFDKRGGQFRQQEAMTGGKLQIVGLVFLGYDFFQLL